MKIDVTDKWLPVYEALASAVRIEMIQLLAKQEMNVKELAQALNLSSAIMTMHVKKLEKAGLINTTMVSSRGGAKKVCSLAVEGLEIAFPSKVLPQNRDYHLTEVSVGHYTDFQIEPTCGLATVESVIGIFDEPRYFLDPERVNAKILWFGQGYVEYKVPNFLLRTEEPVELEVSMEISSEAPFANENWPSDITFFLNGIHVGTWTSPGDFGGGNRGKYTPDWWWNEINQFGLLKVLKINDKGTFIDGQKLSEVTLDQLDIKQKQWTFRMAVMDSAQHVGGLTIFGSGFGNYNQDINFKLYYEKNTQA
ncbi:transcriptional regulator [Paenibacillus sambharensis]|uniref:Transcriptional regulator n=1 Tax=Paenibacillus sambharensis TaxID=1803190 RepID=A0A2W1LI45_9BACL|nr:ArsR family transcriptional regulator [Paenibacillus sambharensis]PZD94194.1 transcriptional regulator [Paenibacillus sambharensis]